jgi:hypothetical protein
MQVSRLSILVLIAFLVGCASPVTSREEADAAAILSGSSEVAGETKTAAEIEEEAQKARTRDNALGEIRCSIAIPCPKQAKYGNGPGETMVAEVWWTLKYTLWGQGSSKDWPWAW